MQYKKSKYIIIVFVTILLLFATMVGIYFLTNNDDIPQDEDDYNAAEGNADTSDEKTLIIESIVEEADWIVVTTSHGKFKYPFAFSDLINVEEIKSSNGDVGVVFSMLMEEEKIPVYTILYGSNKGSVCGSLSLLNDKEPISVSVVFNDVPDGFSDDWKKTFYAVQETFNEVLFSMEEGGNFAIVE